MDSQKTGQKVSGSPAIALQYAEQFTHLYFVEYDPQRAESLRSLIHSNGAEHKATVFTGDCNVYLHTIIERIHPKAPTFVFLDPSAAQLHWTTVQKLADWRTELFILFPLNMTILRLLPKNGQLQEGSRDRLNAVFGTNEWERIYKEKSRTYLISELLNLYTKRLVELGYDHVIKSEVFKSDTGQKLYYMIWVGKHPVGKKIMDHVFEQQDPQLKLF
jgi:three-Cys-motif partner protein